MCLVQLIDSSTSQAIDIVSSQKPESGEAPNGSYHNSRKLSDSLFTDEERDFRNRSLTESMPFLYQLICAKIKGDLPEVAQMDGDLEGLDNKNPNDSDDGMQDLEGNFIQTISDPSAKRAKRAETVSVPRVPNKYSSNRSDPFSKSRLLV
jgi:hypothetical protein